MEATVPNSQKRTLTRIEKAERVVFWIVLISLIGTWIYNVVCIFAAPAPNQGEKFDKTTEDYILTTLMTSFSLFVVFLPSILNKAFKMEIPSFMSIVFTVFLYCASFLGEAQNFFYLVPNWDVYLHMCSSALLGALGFSVVLILNKGKKLNLSPFFLFLFSLCFAMALGALWEIIEYLLDLIFHTNSQKFMTEEGVAFVGAAALKDTMEDLIIDFIGAFTMSLVGLLSLCKKGKLISRFLIGYRGSTTSPLDALRRTDADELNSKQEIAALTNGENTPLLLCEESTPLLLGEESTPLLSEQESPSPSDEKAGTTAVASDEPSDFDPSV